MKQLEGMILIETFVSWFLGVISNGIGEKSKRKREIKTYRIVQGKKLLEK